MIYIVLDELDQAGRVVYLSDAVASALSTTGLVEMRPERDGGWRLLSRGTVGAVIVGDVQVQVTPKEKVGLTRLLFLLGYARDPGFLADEVTAAAEDDLWPALAETLGRLAERALAGGVLQGYRTIDDALRTVRGRIRIGDQISRRPGMMVPLEVTYDDYTVDIPENQILRTALRRVQAVPRLDEAARRRLAHLDARLDGVPLLPHGIPVPAWSATRLNMRYQSALHLAEVVLRHGSVEAGPDGLPMAAFVVSMWKVFEDFVGQALKQSLRRYPGATHFQHRTMFDAAHLGNKGRVPMNVDIAHAVRDRPRLIFDAKYKAAGASGRYPNADLYQMLAYCTVLELPRAWLVYAQGNGVVVERRVRNSDVMIVEYPLDLSATPAELLAQIDRLADAAWDYATISSESIRA